MARLAAALLAWLVGGRGRSALGVKAVRGRWQGGVGGIGVQAGVGVGELLLQLADLLLLLAGQGEELLDLILEGAVGGLQRGDALLGVGLLQLLDTAAQGAQVLPHLLRHLIQRFLIHQTDGHHAAILSLQPTRDDGA